MAQHALLSPSSASRWLTCTPSARLEEQYPDRSGDAAAEGTLAHKLGEAIIRLRTGGSKKDYARTLKDVEANAFYEPAMFEYMDQYAVYVLEQFSRAQKATADAILFLEQRLNLTDYVPEGFGTGDVIIIADGVLDIIDLKYGKGVPVSAENNKQMMLYSLGALREFDYMYNIHSVKMTIYQPRLDSISTCEVSVSDLKKWAEDELKPRAALAYEGAGEFAPGDVCRFCKAAAVCKANADYNLELAKYEFKEPVTLNEEETANILSRADTFTNWLKAVNDYALNEAVNNGKRYPGFKLVEGRSVRVYTDTIKIVEVLKSASYPDEKIMEPASLLGITKLEKAIGKDQFKIHVAPFIVKPPGKPTLVPESDKRPEYNSSAGASADFEEVLTNDLL